MSSHWGSGSHLLLNPSQSESDLAQPGPAGPLLPPHKEDFLLRLCLGEGWANKDTEESFDLAHGLVGQTAQTDSIMSAPTSPSSELSATRLPEAGGGALRMNTMRGLTRTGLTPSTHSSLGRIALFPVDRTPSFLVPRNTAATTIRPQTGRVSFL